MKKNYTKNLFTKSLFNMGLIAFLLCWQFNVNAQGETCATAVAIGTGTHTADGPATGAGAVNNCFGSATNADWYSYTPATNGNMTVTSCAGSADTRLSIYTGTCAALSCFASDDDTCGGTGYSSEVVTPVTAGTTYLIEWDDRWSTGTFDFDLSLTSCIPGLATLTIDASACPVMSINVDLTSLGNAATVNITNDINASEHLGVSALQIYNLAGFSLADGLVTVSITDAADPTCIGTITINIPTACPPANDNCDGAINLTVNPDLACGSTTAGTVVSATPSPEDAAACGGTENDDVWFTFTATATSHSIDLLNGAGSTTDMYFSLWEGTCPGGLTHQGLCSDPESATATGLTIGNTYYLRVYTWSSNVGATSTFDVCIGTLLPPPPEDNCMGAINIPVTLDMCTGITTGNNTASTDSNSDVPAPPAATCSSYAGGDIWFSITVPASGFVTISGAASPDCCSFLWYEIYTGEDCATLTSLQCSSTSGNDPSLFESELTGLVGGSTIWIRAWDSSNDNGPGDFNFCAYEPTCASPTVVIPADPIDNTNCPTSVDVSIDITDLGDSGTLTITGLDDMSMPAGTGGSVSATGIFTLTNVPVPQTSWSITIAHESNASCDVVLGPFVLDCPPLNDDVTNATALTVGAACTAGTNSYSTVEASEPSGSCWFTATPSHSVWYSFVAPACGNVTVNTDFVTGLDDTELCIYEGTGIADFVEIGCGEDDGVTGSGYMAISTLTGLVAGVTYFIQVDGYATVTGDFCVEVTDDGCCTGTTNVILTAAGTTVTAPAVNQCSDPNGWTYYEDPGTGNMVFAIDWGTTPTSIKNQATITVTQGTTLGYTEAGVPGVSGDAGWSMARYWDVDLAGAVLPAPVDVRFYIDPAEKSAIDAAVALDGRAPGFTGWYKTAAGAFGGAPDATAFDVGNEVVLTPLGGVENGIAYVEFASVASFSGGTFSAGVSALLPVTLISFTGEAQARSNKIAWKTATEENTEMHVIERSIDNENWNEIGQVAAAGNSTTEQSYELDDIYPLQKAFYRLKSVDFDGFTDYSDVIVLSRDATVANTISVYPNPFTDDLTINMTMAIEDNVQVELYSLDGKTFITKNYSGVAGSNSFTVAGDALSTGLYYVSIKHGQELVVRKVIKHMKN